MAETTKCRALFAATILLLCALICGILWGQFPVTASADGEESVGKYTYNDISVTADVGEDKVVHITERFEIGFAQESQTQVVRSIRYGYAPGRIINGKFKKGRYFKAKISNVSAEIDNGKNSAKVEISEGKSKSDRVYLDKSDRLYVDIAISKSDGTAFQDIGKLHKIELSYDYDLSSDKYPGIDDLIFIFFNDFSYRIYGTARLNLKLNMPKPFDGDSILIRRINSEELWTPDAGKGEKFSVKDNSVNLTVSPEDLSSLVLQVLLPEGYFDITKSTDWIYWIFFGIVMAIIVFGAALAFVYRQRKPIVTVELTPPNINPLYFSAFWHGNARRRDVCTVILQWAHLGCVHIKKDGARDVILTKIKDLPEGRPEAEKRYFNALFEKGDVYSSAQIRLRKNKWQARSIRWAVKELVFETQKPETQVKGVERAKLAIIGSSIAALLVTAVYFIIISGNFVNWILLFMAGLFGGVSLAPLYRTWNDIKELKESFKVLHCLLTYMLCCFIMGGAVLYVILISSVYVSAYDFAGLLIISLLWIAACLFVLPKFIGKRTEKSQRLYGKMLGFKNFILTAELSRIEALVADNPEYYYEILPYCMIMGISKKLDKRLGYLQLAAPEWADGFALKNFASSLFTSAKSALKGRLGENKKEENDL